MLILSFDSVLYICSFLTTYVNRYFIYSVKYALLMFIAIQKHPRKVFLTAKEYVSPKDIRFVARARIHGHYLQNTLQILHRYIEFAIFQPRRGSHISSGTHFSQSSLRTLDFQEIIITSSQMTGSECMHTKIRMTNDDHQAINIH